MRVILNDDLFANPQTDPGELLSLLLLGYDGRHHIQTDPISSPTVERWLGARDPELRDCCQLALECGLELDAWSPSTRTIRVSHIPEPLWDEKPPVLPLREALRLTRLPFSAQLEDIINDKHFLLAVATAESRAALKRMAAKGWLVFEHGGGITSMRRQAAALTDPVRALRMWLLFDSDAMRPRRPSEASSELAHACERRGLPYHQLARRAIENYIPLPALRKWHRRPEQKRRVRALGKLTPEQRHHYNMKHGFAGDVTRASEAGDLYDDLNADVRSALEHGIGKDIAELFGQEGFPMEAWWFHADGQSSETARMVGMLLSLV